jgi:hypothetical protein
MSIKLKHATIFDNKNSEPQIELDFNADNSAFTTIVVDSPREQKHLVNIFMGKKIIKTGSFEIDDNNKVNKYWTKRHVLLLKETKPFSSWVSIRQALYFSLWMNRDFYVHSKNKYIESKFELLSLKTTKGNKTDYEMRIRVDALISKFINSTTEIEEQWISEFTNEMRKFHSEKIEEIYKDRTAYMKALLYDYVDLGEVCWGNQLRETFLQSLWDKVYSFLDIASSCHCEYNAKASKNKLIKSKIKDLNFHQHYYVVQKYLKQIEVKINDLKRFSFKNKFILRQLRQRIFLEMEKHQKGGRKKIFSELNSWHKLTDDQHTVFREKQDQIIFDNLLDESGQIKGKIVEAMHSYHQKVLTNSIEIFEKKDFDIEIENLGLKVKTIKAQALDWADDLMKQLGIGYDWKHKNNRKARLNQIYYRLLQMFYNKRHNIIFKNTFSTLNREDSEKLLNVISKLKELDPKLTVVFIENKIENIPALISNGYIYEKGILSAFSFSENLKSNPEKYNELIFIKYNKLQFNISKGSQISIGDKKIKFSRELNNSESVMLLDPFSIKTDKKSAKNLIITYNIKGVSHSPFKDPKMKCGVTQSGSKIFYYDVTNELTNEISIGEEAIIKVI